MGKIIKTKYIKYSEDFTKDLLELNNSSISKISQAHMDLGKLWAKEINDWIKKNNLIIDMVGIHGQTIYHNGTHSSLQIGEPLYISKLLKVPVIYNFRIKDIINEGQGAPLMPIVDKWIFNNSKEDVITLNIGGISNLTYVSNFDSLIAFDTGPGMCLLDQYIYKTKGEKFDPYGKYSYNGTVNKKILKNEISDSFFRKKFPKSLDKNYFDLEKYKNLNFYDACATISMFTAESISLGIKQLGKKFESIIVMGGGSRNLFILDQINKITKKNIYSINDYSLLYDQIEAQAFTYLAVRSAKRLPISFPGTTGVKKSITGGDIFKII